MTFIEPSNLSERITSSFSDKRRNVSGQGNVRQVLTPERARTTFIEINAPFDRNVSGQGDVPQMGTPERESKNDFHRSNCRNKSPSAAISIWDVKCRVTGKSESCCSFLCLFQQ
ncbi:hypothetical protein CDAR_590881 [Caerostris darwini]|uniref:Uncharacterized protein n=1 Tax=Caerostris darwini TaxID=1538125 RepID=A0AAV4SFS6_9ARAC|nr:hypothetical protein CDAR_590881 [Caerostris darwini]